MTRYRVFRKNPSTGGSDAPTVPESFKSIGVYEANDAKGAVKAAILAMPEMDRAAASMQTFAACASSSWQVLSPSVKVETTVSFA